MKPAIDPPDPPSLLTLSPSLLTTFNTLRGGQRPVFRRLFIAVWHYLWPISKLDGVLFCAMLPKCLGEVRPHQFFMLCRLYLLSDQGRQTIDRRNLVLRAGDLDFINQLKHLGFIRRTTFDPLAPHLITHRCNAPIFISFTPAGIAFVRGALKRISTAVRDDLLSYQPLSK